VTRISTVTTIAAGAPNAAATRLEPTWRERAVGERDERSPIE